MSAIQQFEQKRVEFRKYLESEGFVDALQKALLKLYDESTKPEDAVLYIRQWICEYCPNEEQFEKMKSDLFSAYVRVAELEVEVEKEKDLIVRSVDELNQELQEVYRSLQEDAQCQSLLRKYLTLEIIDQYKEVTTPEPLQVRLFECIKAGHIVHDAEIGAFACNAACYDTFANVFDPIIREYHGMTASTKPNLHVKSSFGDPDQIQNLDPKKKYIMCTYIKLRRNITGFSFLPKLKFDDYLEVEKKILPTLEQFAGPYAGTYQNLIDIDLCDQEEMVKKRVLFARGDNPAKTAAGIDLYFPFGRGVYINENETFGVWVNAEEHLTVFAKEENGNLSSVYKAVVEGLKSIETAGKMKFALSRNYGFATTDPANLGTAMQVIITIRLPLLSQHLEYVQNMASDLDVKVNAINLEEDEENPDIVLELSNNTTLGKNEFEIIKAFEESVAMFISTEASLEKGAVLQMPPAKNM